MSLILLSIIVRIRCAYSIQTLNITFNSFPYAWKANTNSNADSTSIFMVVCCVCITAKWEEVFASVVCVKEEKNPTSGELQHYFWRSQNPAGPIPGIMTSSKQKIIISKYHHFAYPNLDPNPSYVVFRLLLSALFFLSCILGELGLRYSCCGCGGKGVQIHKSFFGGK